jgi:3-oxoacyl-[acyl-carrier protein] reductase
MSFSLRGKHAVVTGATGAIGFRIAAAFAERGSVVTLLSRSAPDARLSLEHQLTTYQPDPERKDMGDEFPEKHRFMRLDATKSTVFKGLFGSTIGPVDILVNCAGVSQTSFIKRTSDEDIRNILDTNLQSAILASKYAKMNAHGMFSKLYSFITQSYIASLRLHHQCLESNGQQEWSWCFGVRRFKGWPRRYAYNLHIFCYKQPKLLYMPKSITRSLHILAAFTRALATEYSPRSIRVNALLPGWIASPMWDRESIPPSAS